MWRRGTIALPIDHITVRDILTRAQTQRETAGCVGWGGIDWRRRLRHADRWRETAQEAEMGDNAGVKANKQSQNARFFDLDRPSSDSTEKWSREGLAVLGI
jgi:hypothetical protein